MTLPTPLISSSPERPGASPTSPGLVFGGAARIAMPGIVAGGLLALGLAQVLRSFLLGLSPLDPLALAVAIGVLLAAVAAAVLVPARRAVGIQPVEALRSE